MIDNLIYKAIMFGVNIKGQATEERIRNALSLKGLQVKKVIFNPQESDVNFAFIENVDIHIWGYFCRKVEHHKPFVEPALSEISNALKALGLIIIACDSDLTDEELEVYA